MDQVGDCANDQEKPDDDVSEKLNEVDDVDSFGIENASVSDGHCEVNLAKKIHCNVSVEKDRGHQIPANEVPDYVDYQEKPDDKVNEESNEEDVTVSRIEDNTSVDDGHCQVNLAKNIHSSVSVDKDRKTSS